MRALEYERAKVVKQTQKILIKSSEDGRWSITRAFLKCRKEVLLTHENIMFQLRDEFKQHWPDYSSLCDDEMTEQFQKYEVDGICSDAYSDVIIQALANAFKVNILIYGIDDRAQLLHYFIAQEKDCVFPTRNNYVEDTVSLLKEGDVYSALQDAPGKYKK